MTLRKLMLIYDQYMEFRGAKKRADADIDDLIPPGVL
jgi:hypothetical protein